MPTLVIGAGPPRGNARYWHVVQAGFGTNPPADPNPTVTAPGTLNLGGWTTLSGSDPDNANGVIDYTGIRTCKNRSSGGTEPGPAQIILLGDNGWLDPTNPTGPYYGWLVEGVPIRVLLTDGTTFWDDWRGFVLHWPMSESNKRGQAAVIDAYDAVGWLGGINSPYPSDLHRAILQTGPSAYWPHDSSSALVPHDTVSNFDGVLTGAASLSGPALTAERYGASVACNGADPAPGSMVMAPARAMPRPPFTVSVLVFTLPAPAGTSIDIFQAYENASGSGFSMGDISAAVTLLPSTGINANFAGGAELTPGGPYVLTATYDLAGTLQAFLNGALTQSSSAAFISLPAFDVLRWGAFTGGNPGGTQVAHVAVWPRVLSGGEIAGIAAAARTARAGDTVDQRLHYLADLVRWPATKRRFQVAAKSVGPVRMAGATMLDVWKRAVAFEDGILAADAAGNLVFEARYGAPAPSFAVGGSGAPKQEAAYSTVDTTVITAAEVSDPPVLYDSGNDNIVGGRSVKLDQLAFTADDAWLTAQRLVQLGGLPGRPGIDAVTLDPIDVPAALTLDMCNVGTVTRRPVWSGSDLLEPYQVTAVTSTGGGGKPAKRQFSMVQPRASQLFLSCNPLIFPTMASGATAAYLARYNPGTDLVVEAQVRASDWFLATTQTLVAHGDSTGGWAFYLTANGLGFIWVDNALGLHVVTSLPVVRTGRRWLWVKAVFGVTAGGVIFYVSPDNRSNYTPWGSGTIGGATTVKTSTDGLHVGEAGGAGGTALFGDVLKALVSTFAGVPIATFDPTADNQPSSGVTVARSWTSSTGEAWTLQPHASLQFG